MGDLLKATLFSRSQGDSRRGGKENRESWRKERRQEEEPKARCAEIDKRSHDGVGEWSPHHSQFHNLPRLTFVSRRVSIYLKIMCQSDRCSYGAETSSNSIHTRRYLSRVSDLLLWTTASLFWHHAEIANVEPRGQILL